MSSVDIMNRYVHGASTGSYRSPEQQERDHQNLFKDGPGLTINQIKEGKVGRGTADNPVRNLGDLTIPGLCQPVRQSQGCRRGRGGQDGRRAAKSWPLSSRAFPLLTWTRTATWTMSTCASSIAKNPDLLSDLTKEPTTRPDRDIPVPDGAGQEEPEQPDSWGSCGTTSRA